MNWLDTETKAILKKEDELKLAPSKAAEFALILLRKGNDERRLTRAISRINDCGESEAAELIRSVLPVTIDPGLTESEALFGQFELICCDAIGAFIRSEVLEQSGESYLRSLFGKVSHSPEFRRRGLKSVRCHPPRLVQDLSTSFSVGRCLSGIG